ncbi:hypothetical protein DSCO28_02740 [Desulfosarcina ovata subsp. sediminis]|uniref:Uncharacterized protein n=1 Tax=Desulfosarcina ovata subsp. sediminis TaxID=885957 RepID=A0A5K7ZC22_9BACT|nr:hypothetical protein [Desulfosarcina ovata]BBO79708.1 hypothetical protein DSCO28_02740 [Desulfosarcina ovata subsp. sediminis]
MESPSLTWAIFDDFHGQADDAVGSELIAADETGGQVSAGVYHWSQFFSDRPLQVAQPII